MTDVAIKAAVLDAASVGAGGRIAGLDGLRGAAALMVVVAHYFGEVPGGIAALAWGWVGV